MLKKLFEEIPGGGAYIQHTEIKEKDDDIIVIGCRGENNLNEILEYLRKYNGPVH